MQVRKVLVTGGADFLGNHLYDRLVESGDDVMCVDNFFIGGKRIVASFIGKPYFEPIRHDVTLPLYVEVDEIYNLACPASPVHYQFAPEQTTITSVYGAINMLSLAKRCKSKILQASTSEVDGDPEVPPQPAGYLDQVNTIGIRRCCDEGKRCAETFFFDYHRQHQVRINVVMCIFNSCGTRTHPNDGRVMSDFIMQALRGEDITLCGHGLQTLNLCYVDDLLDAMIRVMDTADNFHDPINVDNPTEFTMAELAGQVLSLTVSMPNVIDMPVPSDDPLQRRPDFAVTKAKLD
jgi:UDP-glucuronate decarboxylase